jgi:tetratricopeptide (TPR) repeat protein
MGQEQQPEQDDEDEFPEDIEADGPPELNGILGWQESSASNRLVSSNDPTTQVRSCLRRRAQSGEFTAVPDMLALSAPNSSVFWSAVASELHAAGQHYEALDAWSRARKFHRDGDCCDDSQFIGREIWAGAEAVDDNFLYEKASEYLEAAGEWDDVIQIQGQLGAGSEELLDLIWKALENGYTPDEDEWRIESSNEELDPKFVNSWETMAQAMLYKDDLPRALLAWSNAAKHSSSSDFLCSVITGLIEEARRRGFSEEDFIHD